MCLQVSWIRCGRFRSNSFLDGDEFWIQRTVETGDVDEVEANEILIIALMNDFLTILLAESSTINHNYHKGSIFFIVQSPQKEIKR
jgi:hypothetical protein